MRRRWDEEAVGRGGGGTRRVDVKEGAGRREPRRPAMLTSSGRVSGPNVNRESRRRRHVHVSHVDASRIDSSHVDASHVDDGSHMALVNASHIDAQWRRCELRRRQPGFPSLPIAQQM